MNFKRFGITTLQVVGLGLLPTAVLADVNQTTTFKGAVPGSCSYVSGQNQNNVALTYASETTELCRVNLPTLPFPAISPQNSLLVK